MRVVSISWFIPQDEMRKKYNFVKNFKNKELGYEKKLSKEQQKGIQFMVYR